MKKILSPMEKMRFPESEELPEGVKEIEVKDTFGYCTELYPDVEYAEHSGKKLHLQIMPWRSWSTEKVSLHRFRLR